MGNPDIKKQVENAIFSPKKVETAEGRVEEHSLTEIVEAAKFLEQTSNENMKFPFGIFRAIGKPTGRY